ncbi:MAG: ATP-binding protein, partial [Myxococcaceae bacterium]
LGELHSLSLREIEQHLGGTLEGEQLLRWMWCGGYPEIVARDLNPRRFYADYVATYLERDVRQLLNVRDLRDFDRFLRLCALRTGQLISMNDLASDVGKSPPTLKSWLGVLEASNVIRLLPPYFRNLGKRLVKTPKLYFLDVGLAAFLCGLDGPDAIRSSSLLGALWETTVFGQLVRHFSNRCEPADLYFYRDHHGTEVDFVIPVGEKLRLFECKWAESPSPEVRAFRELERLMPPGTLLSKSLLVPRRGSRTVGDVVIEDAVELRSLSIPAQTENRA